MVVGVFMGKDVANQIWLTWFKELPEMREIFRPAFAKVGRHVLDKIRVYSLW